MTYPTKIESTILSNISRIEWGWNHTWFISKDCEQNIDSILSSGSNKKHQLGYQDKNISNELKDRYDLLDLLEEQKYKLIDLQVWWNSTIFYWMRDNQPVILIWGDHKHGKVDFESDLQLDGALSWFYSKQM